METIEHMARLLGTGVCMKDLVAVDEVEQRPCNGLAGQPQHRDVAHHGSDLAPIEPRQSSPTNAREPDHTPRH